MHSELSNGSGNFVLVSLIIGTWKYYRFCRLFFGCALVPSIKSFLLSSRGWVTFSRMDWSLWLIEVGLIRLPSRFIFGGAEAFKGRSYLIWVFRAVCRCYRIIATTVTCQGKHFTQKTTVHEI